MTLQQAKDYVARVGTVEAKRSNHYLAALRYCRCGTCYCCEVFHAVHDAELRAKQEREAEVAS